MGRTLAPRYLAALDIHALDDERIHELAICVAEAAPTSTLVQQNPLVQAAVADFLAGDGQLSAAGKAVADDRNRLALDITAAVLARSAVISRLRTLASTVSGAATEAADVVRIGLPLAAPRSPLNQEPPVPVTIDQRPSGKNHRQVTVSAHETGPIRYQYIAEQSLDGVTWTPLGIGRGKTRVLTGASGTQVWVRFASVRGKRQSAWSTPTCVVFP